MKIAAADGVGAPYRLPVYIACTVLAVVTNYLLGKDMASDALSYHLYAGFSAVHDRFAQDYFPAGPQSYFNPYVYVPLYYLVSSSLSSLEISSLLAIAHSIILWLTYELAVSVCPSDGRRQRLIFGLCGVAFALINPVLLQQIGSTFADITTGEFVLAGWLLLALAVRAPSNVRVACAGLLCGVATGLKLTNAVHAIAGFAVLIMLPLAPWRRVRQGLAYGISLGLGFLVIAAPWSLRLERRFGNPLFPMMNNVFRSPEFTTETGSATRFVPDSIAEALWRPFAMIDPVPMVHQELRSPDLRYALLVMLVGALLCRWIWRRRARAAAGADSASARVLAALGCGLAVDWAIWLAISGNSRYFLPMSCVAAVVVVGLSYRLFETHPKARNYILAGVLGIQGVQLWMGTDYRWNQSAWDEHWINIAIPAKLASVANLYLTMGTPTNSFMALYLPPGSGLVNFTGLYTLGPDGANGARIAALISQFAPNVRMLVHGERLYRKDERRMPNAAQIDDALRPFGLRIDDSDCATITVHGLTPDMEIMMATSQPAVTQSLDTTYLLSCRVAPDKTDYSAQVMQHRDIDLALDHLEDACPALFQPRRPRTEYSGEGGLRRYIGSDMLAWVSNGRVKFLQPMLGGEVAYLGTENEWAKAPIQLQCGRRNGRYFARPATLQ
jgi:Glycosyltransferase family 87